MRIHADFVSFNEMVSFAKQLVELTEKKKAEGAAQPAAGSQSQAAQKPKAADQPQPVHTTAPVQQTPPAQLVPTMAPQPPAAPQVQTTAAASAVPQAPVPVSAAPPQTPVQSVPPTVPTGAKEYTMDELAVAAIPLMDAGAGGQQMLIDLLHQFGTDALPNLPKSQYGAFATALRGLGAKI